MIKRYLFVILPFYLLGSTSYAQYCTAVGPYYSDYSYMTSFNLSGESGTSISFVTGCPGPIYLNDQTFAESVTLDGGNFYSASAGFSTCSIGYPGVGQGWIDYNQNQLFEPSESIGTWTGTPPVAPAIWNFMVPTTAINGTTRMRVMQVESGFLPLDPCALYWWGSAVDFTVNITGGVDCAGYIGQTLDDPREVSALPYSESYSNAVCYFNEFPAYQSADVFYRVIPSELGIDYFTVSLCGSSFDTYLAVIDSDTNVIATNDDFASCSPYSQVTVAAALADTFYVIVEGWGIFAGDYDISITEELTSTAEYSTGPLLLYPNPAKTEIGLNTQLSGLVSLFDLSGNLVLTRPYHPGDLISLADLAPGFYLVKLTGDNSEHFTKLIKE